MQKSMLFAAFLLPLLIIIPISAYAQTSDITVRLTGEALIDGVLVPVETNRGVDSDMIVITFTFSESVTGFTFGDLNTDTFENTRFDLTGSGAVYELSATVDSPQSESISVILKENTEVFDLSGARHEVNSMAYTIGLSPAPVPTISSTTVAHLGATDADIIQFNVGFNEHTTNVQGGDISVTSTAPAGTHTVSGFPSSTSGTSFNFRIESGSTDGTIRVSMPANGAIDLSKVPNVASNVYIATFGPADNTAPTATLSASVGNDERTVDDSVRFTATFSERVPEGFFTQEDITVASTATSGTHVASAPVASGTDGTAFTFDVPRNDAEGTITVSIPAGAVTDFAGNDNTASTAHQVSFGVRPVVITASVGNNTIINEDTVTFTATFSNPIMPDTFTASDITVDSTAPANTHVASEPVANMDNTAFTFDVPRNSIDGVIMVSIPQGAVTHTDNFVNEASNVYSVIFNTGQLITVQITSDTDNPDPIGARASFNVEFSNPVTEFDLGDITVSSIASNGTVLAAGAHVASNLAGTGMEYTFDVLRGPSDATVTVSIPANAVEDNVASNDLTADLELSLRIDYTLARTEDRTFAALDIALSNSGDSIFLVDTADMIRQFALGTNFDITTAADSGPTYDILIDEEPRSLVFSSNGEQMFMIGNTADDVLQFALTGPFDISNPSHSNVDLSFSAATTAASGLALSRDGTHVYVVGSANNGQTPGIYDFPLTTGFALNTGAINNFVSSDPFTDQFPIDLAINDEGTIMYVLSTSGRDTGSGDMRHLDAFTFGVAYDVRTLTFEATQPLVTYPTRGMAFSPDFSRLYVVGVATDNPIAEFTLNARPVLGPATLSIAESSNINTLSPIPGSDPDGDTLAYRISGNPGWLSIDGSTGQLSGVVPQDNSPNFRNTDTPARCDLDGSVTFTVTVSDDGFDVDDTDDVSRVYTIAITNTVRISNSLPTVVDGEGINLAFGAEQLDLSVHSTDSNGDTLTYFGIIANDNTVFDRDSIRIDRNTGVATFTSLNAVGEAIIRYMVCDGSATSELAVSTITTAPLEIIPDQMINEGQTLDSLRLNITSDTVSPLFNVTQISIEGDIVPIFALNQSIAIMDLDPLSTNTTDFPDGNPDLNGTAPGGGSVNDDNLQRSFRISSIEGLDEGDPRLDARFEEEERQIDAGVPFGELIDPYTIIHTIPDDFVDAGLAQSPPIRIAYTYVLENGDVFSGIFDMVVNRVDEAPEIILPLEVTYVFDPESPTRTIDLADHFMDPGSDNIVYNVTNPNPRIADVTITGDMLSIDPVSSGIVNAILCAESQATGIANAATCAAITVLVRGLETTEFGIFRDSSVNANHDLLDADVVLNWNDFAINPTVAFNHIIITADNADATGEIQINHTGRTRITELTSNGTAVTSRIFTSNGSGSISYDPASDFTSTSDSVTFTAILHGPAIDPSEGVITGEIIPLFHDTLTVNYIIVNANNDAAPGELQIGLTFGPRHTSDRFDIALNDLFEDPDNSRPRLDVTITDQSNQALSASIVGDRLIVTPPGPNCNCQTLFTFTLDDGINTPQIETLLFRFESDLAGTVPVGFPQYPVGRIFLQPGFDPFLINLADLAVRGETAAFAENVTVSNVQLPEDGSNNPDTSHINATVFNATHFQIAPGTNDLIGFEIISFDVRFTEDPVDVVVFTQYRLEFADAPVAAQQQAPSGGGDDDTQWKTKPTFGKSYTTDKNIVDCGYSMDGTCRNVADYHVDYKRETITTDSLHDFTLKAYAQNGLRSFNVGFGLPGIGSPLNSAEAQINVNLARDYSLYSTYKIVSVEYSNENNVIGEDATFAISRAKCLPTDKNNLCVQLGIEGVLFRETMYDEPFAINAIDSKRRGTTHYMNEGLLVYGDSLNIPPTHELSERHSNQGDAVKLHLTRTDKLADIWTDQLGHQWTKNSFGTWSYVNAPPIDMSSACTDEDNRACDAFDKKWDMHVDQMEKLRDSLYGNIYAPAPKDVPDAGSQ